MDGSSKRAVTTWRISSSAKGTTSCARRRESLSSALTSEASAAEGLYERLASLGDAPLSLDERTRLLERFFALPSRREKPGRFWRVDFDSIIPDAGAID